MQCSTRRNLAVVLALHGTKMIGRAARVISTLQEKLTPYGIKWVLLLGMFFALPHVP